MRPAVRCKGSGSTRAGRSALIGVCLSLPCSLQAQALVEFDAAFLRSPVDIGMFSRSGQMPAGEHRVDVMLNEAWKGRHSVRFGRPDGSRDGTTLPCFDAALLSRLGLDLDALSPETLAALRSGPVCRPLAQIVPGARAVVDSQQLSVAVTAPQILLQRAARGYVDPAQWDHGITAGTLQYDYLGYHTRNARLPSWGSESTHYLGLRAGFNAGPWRLRYRGALNAGNRRETGYQGIAAYAERGISPWRSKLTLGDAITEGRIFDSLSFRGVQLASEDQMYEDSRRGFAPIVQGFANSNARVRISQQGNVIYETSVPPGPFLIDDLYPTGMGGDLLVRVTEADGSEQSYTVAFASIPELLRPGVTRYSLMAGRYRNTYLDHDPSIVMATLRHGVSNVVTGYGGLIGAEGYQAAAGGVGLNTRLGALSSDLTVARSDLDAGGKHRGHSIRLAYAKILPVTQTNVTLATYRYSSAGYYDANEAFQLRGGAGGRPHWAYLSALDNRRNRFQLSLSQSLPPGWGTLSLNASRQDYWRRAGVDTEFQVQYNNQYGRIGYGISAGRTRNLQSGAWNNQVALTLSMPLGSAARSPNLSVNLNRDNQSRGVQTTLSGVAGSDSQLFYSAYASSIDSRPGARSSMGGASASWSAPFAHLGASASAGSGYRQYSASASGGLVLYAGGVVLGPMLSDTAALIEARDAEGARVSHHSGLRLDRRGRAIVPYLSPYRQNTLEIDPQGVSTDVALKETSRNLAPTAGAIALMRFETERGYSLLMTLVAAQGQAVPFGASVLDAQCRHVGYVAQAGQALLRLSQAQGTLQIRWGDDAASRCFVAYDLSQAGPPRAAGFRDIAATCEPSPQRS